jgi:hypothetical protein
VFEFTLLVFYFFFSFPRRSWDGKTYLGLQGVEIVFLEEGEEYLSRRGCIVNISNPESYHTITKLSFVPREITFEKVFNPFMGIWYLVSGFNYKINFLHKKSH